MHGDDARGPHLDQDAQRVTTALSTLRACRARARARAHLLVVVVPPSGVRESGRRIIPADETFDAAADGDDRSSVAGRGVHRFIGAGHGVTS